MHRGFYQSSFISFVRIFPSANDCLILIKKLPMVSIFLPPIQNQEKSEQHPSQVGKVSHIVVTAIRDSHKELNQSVSDDKIFGFDRNRYKHEI